MADESQTVFIVHTSSVSVDDLTGLFAELAPSAVVRHIIDDSLLADVLANGGVTSGVSERLASYYAAAEMAGADLIFNQCSSVGDVADAAAAQVGVPLVRVDRRMAERAVEIGGRIGIIATLPTTMAPTSKLIRNVADEMGKQVEVEEHLVDGAFEALVDGDRETHNSMVIAAVKELAEHVDVVVCAQGSMVALLDRLADERIPVPVLTSPRLGVEHAVEVLRRTATGGPAGGDTG